MPYHLFVFLNSVSWQPYWQQLAGVRPVQFSLAHSEPLVTRLYIRYLPRLKFKVGHPNWITIWQEKGPEYFENIFSLSLVKTNHQIQLKQTKCLLVNFWMIKLSKPFCQIPVPNGFFWYKCKLKVIYSEKATNNWRNLKICFDATNSQEISEWKYEVVALPKI